MKQCDGMASAKDEELVRCYQQDKDDRLLAFFVRALPENDRGADSLV